MIVTCVRSNESIKLITQCDYLLVTAYRKRKTRIRSTFNTGQISECPSRLCPLMQNPDDVTAVV